MINLFVAIILDSFGEIAKADYKDASIPTMLVTFRRVWKKYDRNHDYMIPGYSVPAIIYDLPPPMGLNSRTLQDFSDAIKAADEQEQGRDFLFQNNDYNLAANRLDTNKEFSKFQTGKLSGTIAVEEKIDSITDEKL